MPHDLGELIRLDAIPEVFSVGAVSRITTNEGLSLDAAPDRQAALMPLANDVRASVRAYVLAKPRPTTNMVRGEIEDLALAAASRDYETLLPMWANLSDNARHLLKIRAHDTLHMVEARARARQHVLLRTGRLSREPDGLILTLPTVADLRDPERQTWACDMIFRLCAVGRGEGHGYSNSESHAVDNHHHDSTALRFHAPGPTKKEPSREPERELFQSLEIDCYTATGRMPPKSGRHAMAGPIDRYIAQVFRLARVPVSDDDDDRCGLVVRLRNEIGPLREKAKMSQRLRHLLDLWRQEDDLVDEVRSSLARGAAEAVRVPAGSDQSDIPRTPAFIEFEETGTICFWHPSFGHRTIAIEPVLRREIMRCAQRLTALNARERHMLELRKSRRSARQVEAKAARHAAHS
jgi:hypothetical protein